MVGASSGTKASIPGTWLFVGTAWENIDAEATTDLPIYRQGEVHGGWGLCSADGACCGVRGSGGRCGWGRQYGSSMCVGKLHLIQLFSQSMERVAPFSPVHTSRYRAIKGVGLPFCAYRSPSLYSRFKNIFCPRSLFCRFAAHSRFAPTTLSSRGPTILINPTLKWMTPQQQEHLEQRLLALGGGSCSDRSV